MADWTTQAADAIENVVVAIREKAVIPAERASRKIVYGVFAGILGFAVLVLLSIMAFRILSIPLPVWAAWLVLGGIFVVLGAFLFSRRTRFEQGTESV